MHACFRLYTWVFDFVNRGNSNIFSCITSVLRLRGETVVYVYNVFWFCIMKKLNLIVINRYKAKCQSCQKFLVNKSTSGLSKIRHKLVKRDPDRSPQKSYPGKVSVILGCGQEPCGHAEKLSCRGKADRCLTLPLQIGFIMTVGSKCWHVMTHKCVTDGPVHDISDFSSTLGFKIQWWIQGDGGETPYQCLEHRPPPLLLWAAVLT